ncbi:hypothetical protein GCM10007857_44000 [Bradyrhizobium iriomotense]|uniref:Uncharacterized protein n=2 Tax=Bradyrhizobium iriomotense TaxID=441950 RepID=A0ABQ6AZS0_9BRAD|nr:hypothetical protein GCM10007857_44000 [Bradyrhizobium iriomotense]
MADLYSIMKARALPLARTIVMNPNEDAFATIMSDSDDPRQASFLMMLKGTIPAERHRRILLDGLAREYSGVDGWLAYVDRECKQN